MPSSFQQRSLAGLKPGTIYPILDWLLKVEWLKRRRENINPAIEGRPKRRLYRLTPVGMSAARSALEENLVSLGNRQLKRSAVRPQSQRKPA
jgi:DNA-binding PadR family transcriptional regulator